MSLRPDLQIWTRVAALLAAAAIVLAAPYGVAVAMRSAIGPGGPPDATLPLGATAAAAQASSSIVRRRRLARF